MMRLGLFEQIQNSSFRHEFCLFNDVFIKSGTLVITEMYPLFWYAKKGSDVLSN